MERALLFGTTLALIWAGQSLLRTSQLAGLAMLVAVRRSQRPSRPARSPTSCASGRSARD